MYTVKTQDYKSKKTTFKDFVGFNNALDYAKKFVKDYLDLNKTLTRHPSWTTQLRHLDYYADSYNEIFVEIKKKAYPKIGEVIKSKRKLRGVRQKDLAKAVGITPSYLSQVENGYVNIGRKTLDKIAAELNLTVVIDLV